MSHQQINADVSDVFWIDRLTGNKLELQEKQLYSNIIKLIQVKRKHRPTKLL